MKRSVCFLLVALLILSLCACGQVSSSAASVWPGEFQGDWYQCVFAERDSFPVSIESDGSFHFSLSEKDVLLSDVGLLTVDGKQVKTYRIICLTPAVTFYYLFDDNGLYGFLMFKSSESDSFGYVITDVTEYFVDDGQMIPISSGVKKAFKASDEKMFLLRDDDTYDVGKIITLGENAFLALFDVGEMTDGIVPDFGNLVHFFVRASSIEQK